MKILVVGDKESPFIWDHFDPVRFKDVKIIISTGDVRPEYLSFLVTMINAPLLYVHGNHDALYLSNTPEGCENIDGKLVTINGINILGMGGSQLYNHGPFQYTDREMSLRLIKLKFKLWRKKPDIFVSHAPSSGINDGDDICHRGFKTFRNLLDMYKPKYHLHGHQHLSYGTVSKRITQYGETTIINSEGYHLFEY